MTEDLKKEAAANEPVAVPEAEGPAEALAAGTASADRLPTAESVGDALARLAP